MHVYNNSLLFVREIWMHILSQILLYVSFHVYGIVHCEFGVGLVVYEAVY